MSKHGSKELDQDAAKLVALGADPGPTLDDIYPTNTYQSYGISVGLEPQVGLLIELAGDSLWLSWDETVNLAAWLAETVKTSSAP